MTAEPGPEVASRLLDRARAEAKRLVDDGVVSVAFVTELDAKFEASAVRALRVPVISERAAWLRRVAKRLVPEPARPPLRRLVVVADAVLRRGFALVESLLARR